MRKFCVNYLGGQTSGETQAEKKLMFDPRKVETQWKGEIIADETYKLSLVKTQEKTVDR